MVIVMFSEKNANQKNVSFIEKFAIIQSRFFESSLFWIVYFFFIFLILYYISKFYAVAEPSLKYLFFVFILQGFINYLSNARKTFLIQKNTFSKLTKIFESEKNE